MANLKLKNIYKVYDGGVRAVNDFNLEIEDKEFIVFVGPSGCGKSTTLRMIAGLEEITAGELYIDDSLVNDVEPKDRNIAMVFQNYALYPHMTVFQNMAFGLKIRKEDSKEIEDRVNKAAKILGITDLLTRKPKALSGGQRQRVALGRAIVREPKVFLLDEPLSNLDAKLRVLMRTEITKLHQKLQTTFIYVTHDQTEAMTMGDRIVVMKDGFMQQVDTPATLYEEPANVFVATFLGSPQMNIFNVKLLEGLAIKFNDNIVDFTSLKSKQLIDSKYINKEVIFGIRPENISLSDDGIKAKVDQVEHLGSETILYCKVDGLENNIVCKITSNHEIKQDDNICLAFDMNKAHLFDKETELSILGCPVYNEFDAKLVKDKLVIKDIKFDLTEDYKSHLFDIASNTVKVKIATNKLSLVNIPDSIKIKATVDFIISNSDYDIIYAKCDLKNDNLVIKTKKGQVKNNKEIDVYIPINNLILEDKNKIRMNSKEKIFENTCKCKVFSDDLKTYIKLKNTTLTYDKFDIEDGDYTFKLLSNKVKTLYTKKFAKANNLEYKTSTNALKVKAYDEDRLGSVNACFVEIPGFENYVTLLLDNTFSVYQMPDFEIEIPKGSFELI